MHIDRFKNSYLNKNLLSIGCFALVLINVGCVLCGV